MELQRASARVGRMTSGNPSMAVEDLAGPDDPPVILEDAGQFTGAIDESFGSDAGFEQIAQNLHLMLAFEFATREEKLAALSRMSPPQIHAMDAMYQMGGALMSEHPALAALRAAKTTADKRRVMMGGSFQDFADDADAGIGGFFRSLLNPKVWIPALLAGTATVLTGGTALPVFAAGLAAAAPGIGGEVASAAAQSAAERAARAEDAAPAPDIARQIGVSI
jgi:hypothetical protein